MNLWRRIAAPFRDFGALAGLLYATDRVLSMFSSRLRLYVYELTAQPVTDKPLLPRRFTSKIAIREIRAGDPAIARMPVRPEVMAERWRAQATCLAAFKDSALIGYMWFCSPSYDEDEVRCTYRVAPEGSAVFDFDFYLFPEYRLGLAFAALWNGANQFLNERGVRYTFSRLTRFNLASRQAHRHFNLKLVGRALFLKAWQVEFMLATIRPFFHVGATEGSRVRFDLRGDSGDE